MAALAIYLLPEHLEPSVTEGLWQESLVLLLKHNV
jgi:hypothetical protein